jgi:hypothetical protein
MLGLPKDTFLKSARIITLTESYAMLCILHLCRRRI